MKKPRIVSDLFGLVLQNYLNGDKTPYTIVRDDGYTDYPLDPADYFRTHTWHIREAKGKVLDVGCGSGEYLLALRAKGLKAHGIDLDNTNLHLKHDL